jgi:DNA-binding NarL/FixJ family response regulator
MASLRKFLIVDDDARGRFYISKTLLRHFPEAVVQECQDLNTVLTLVRNLPVGDHRTVVIAHQTPQADGRRLVEAVRAAHSSLPIVWTGEPCDAHWAKSAGATRFLDKNAWLMIGQEVEDLV